MSDWLNANVSYLDIQKKQYDDVFQVTAEHSIVYIQKVSSRSSGNSHGPNPKLILRFKATDVATWIAETCDESEGYFNGCGIKRL